MSGKVEIKEGNIFDSEKQTLVNTINCSGVMGKGLALQFKRRFPKMFKDYKKRCERGEVEPGKPYIYKDLYEKWILNFPTKKDWRESARWEYIEKGLEYLKAHYREWGIESMAVPALGSSHGTLDWKIIGPEIYKILCEFEIPIELYVPLGESAENFKKHLEKQTSNSLDDNPNRIRPGLVALVAVIAELEEKNAEHIPLQEIAYFLTMKGLETGLNYQLKDSGPYAYEFKRVINQLVNNGLIEKQNHKLRVGPLYRNAKLRFNNELQNWNSIIKDIAELFAGVDSRQAKFMAMVHMVTQEFENRTGRKPSSNEVTKEVLYRSQKEVREMIMAEIKKLAKHGWIKIEEADNLVRSNQS